MGTWWWASVQGIFIFLLVFVLPTLTVKCFIPFRVTSAIFSESHSPKVPLIWSQSTAGTTVATIFPYFCILNVLIWGALILHRLPLPGLQTPAGIRHLPAGVPLIYKPPIQSTSLFPISLTSSHTPFHIPPDLDHPRARSQTTRDHACPRAWQNYSSYPVLILLSIPTLPHPFQNPNQVSGARPAPSSVSWPTPVPPWVAPVWCVPVSRDLWV